MLDVNVWFVWTVKEKEDIIVKENIMFFVLSLFWERERESSTLLDSVYCVDIFGCIYGHLLYRLDWDYARLYFWVHLWPPPSLFLHIKLNNNTSWLDNHRHKHIMAACFTIEDIIVKENIMFFVLSLFWERERERERVLLFWTVFTA